MEETNQIQNDVDKITHSSSNEKTDEGNKTDEAVDTVMEDKQKGEDPKDSSKTGDLDIINQADHLDDPKLGVLEQETEAEKIQNDVGKISHSSPNEKADEGNKTGEAVGNAMEDAQKAEDTKTSSETGDLDDPEVGVIDQEMKETEKIEDDVGKISDGSSNGKADEGIETGETSETARNGIQKDEDPSVQKQTDDLDDLDDSNLEKKEGVPDQEKEEVEKIQNDVEKTAQDSFGEYLDEKKEVLELEGAFLKGLEQGKKLEEIVEESRRLEEERMRLEEERRCLEEERSTFVEIMSRYLEKEREKLEEQRRRFEEEREKLEEVEKLLVEVRVRLEERRKRLEEKLKQEHKED